MVKVELAGYRTQKKLICPEHFTDNIKRLLSNKIIYSKEIIVLRPGFEAPAVSLQFITAFPESSTGTQLFLLTQVPIVNNNNFSPNNIHMLPREMVMRVNKMITKEKML